jgi:hypothetical protein
MKPTWIVIHHSATADSRTVSWDAIRKYHMETNGWNDIGYHCGVELVGDKYKVQFGRSPTIPGAHCKELGFNNKSLGVCLVGDFDSASPSQELWQQTVTLTNVLMKTYGIPVEQVVGHREVGAMAGFDWQRGQYKSCPGKLFDMPALRAALILTTSV